jgi:asparagine N-glycosylation enzyme membrane subunit Stt3
MTGKNNRNRLAAISFVAILVIAGCMRLWTLGYNWFYEPDIYLYYSVILQTLANGLRIPNPLHYTGFPIHTSFSEKPGLIYITLVPYLMARAIDGNISLYSVFRILPALSGIFEVIAAYLLAYALTKKRGIALLAMLFMAVIPAGVVHTIAGRSRGDAFVPTMAAFIMLAGALALSSDVTVWKRIGMLSVVIVLLAWAAVTWTGYVYLYGLLLLFGIGCVVFFITKDLIKTSLAVLSIGIIGWVGIWAAMPHVLPAYYAYFSQRVWNTIAETQPPNILGVFTGLDIFALFAPIGVIAYAVHNRKNARDGVYAYAALFACLVIGSILAGWQIRWESIVALPVAVFSAYAVSAISDRASHVKSLPHLGPTVFSACVSLTIILSLGLVLTISPQNAPTQQFMNAMSWLRGNTAPNSTIMTLWEDGSIVQAFSNRTVYVDSVDWGQNSMNLSTIYKIYNFSSFLVAKEGNFTFLGRTKPDYLVAMEYWMNDSQSIEGEANRTGINVNYTNLYLITHPTGSALFGYGAELTRVYNNTDVIIYKVSAT